MVSPGQIPDGAQVVAVVALVPGQVGTVGSVGTVDPVLVPPGRWASGRPGTPRAVAPVRGGAAAPAGPRDGQASHGRRPPAPAPAPGEVARTLEPPPARLIGPGLLLDLDGRRVLAAGRPLDLTRREFDLLAYLANRPGRVLTRAQLLAAIWSPADVADAGPRTVDVHVARLRRKLGSHGTPLSTLRGVGYRWSRG
jgi:hypothetical protein